VEDAWRNFSWRDGERTILFGAGRLGDSPRLLAENGYERYDLLTTPRAQADAPSGLAEGAASIHEVASGGVDEAAAPLVDAISSGHDLVAFGGGRVVDVAKAIAAVRGGRVAAIPTTLAGSTITAIHRLPAGHESEAKGLVRPALAIADPVPMTSAPEEQLRATAMNALAHGAESLYAPGANPVAELAALRGAGLIAGALDTDRIIRDRDELALGGILGAWAVGTTGIAMHHAICQTLVRVQELPHAEANATMLPHTMAAMSQLAPAAITGLAGALGTSGGAIAARISELGGGTRHLAEIGADPDRIDEVLDVLDARGDATANTPGNPEREDFRRIIETAM